MPPTQRDIARLAGVTQATVSLALRGHPRISQPLRDRVVRLAARAGYTCDPVLSTAMHQVRSSGRSFSRGTIGMVWAVLDQEQAMGLGNSPLGRSVRKEAEAAHLAIEEMVVSVGSKLSGKRIHQILRTRGCTGILVLEPTRTIERMSRYRVRLEEILQGLPAVLVGRELPEAFPAVAVAPDWAQAARTAVDSAIRLGFERPGLLVTDARLYESFVAGYLGAQAARIPQTEHLPVLEFSWGIDFDNAFPAWIRKYQPDCLLLHTQIALDRPKRLEIEKGRIPVIYGDVSAGGPAASGTRIPWEEIGRVAMESLISQVLFKRGGNHPAVPTRVLIRATWQAGKELVAPTSRRSPAVQKQRSLRTALNQEIHAQNGWISDHVPPAFPEPIRSGIIEFKLSSFRDGTHGLILMPAARARTAGKGRLRTRVAIPLRTQATHVHILHACAYAEVGALLGNYHFNFRDGKRVTIDIRSLGQGRPMESGSANRHLIQDWWKTFPLLRNERVKPVYISPGKHGAYPAILYHFSWRNPHPTRELKSLEIEVPGDAPSTLGVLAITTEKLS